MESSSSDEEDCQLGFWNNWVPPPKTEELDVANKKSFEKRIPIVRHNLSDVSKALSIITEAEDPKFGNWVPPLHFLTTTVREIRKSIPKESQEDGERLNNENTEINEIAKEIRRDLESSVNTSTNSCLWKKNVNLDWGERRQLHDVTRFNEGDLMWGVVHVGIFGSIKLWVNEYGNICCLACGKISKLGSSEITFISITDVEVLRKMLNMSISQWASLCELVKETKTILKFDAFEDFNLTKTTSLERLWFLICKRRHFLPSQCMLLKFCGAVKCLRKLEITPKLLVQDIRNIN